MDREGGGNSIRGKLSNWHGGGHGGSYDKVTVLAKQMLTKSIYFDDIWGYEGAGGLRLKKGDFHVIPPWDLRSSPTSLGILLFTSEYWLRVEEYKNFDNLKDILIL